MDCSNYSTVMRMLNHKSEEINMKVIITRMKELMLSSYMRVKDSFCSQHWIKQSKDYIWSNLTRWSEKDHLIDWCTLHNFEIKTQRFQQHRSTPYHLFQNCIRVVSYVGIFKYKWYFKDVIIVYRYDYFHTQIYNILRCQLMVEYHHLHVGPPWVFVKK